MKYKLRNLKEFPILFKRNVINMNDVVNYKIAKKLKDIGFNEECLYNYNPSGVLMTKWFELGEDDIETVTIDMILNQFKLREDFYKAPTFYQVFKWFREVHNINSSICSECIGSGYFDFVYAYKVYYFKPEEENKKRPKRTVVNSFAVGGGTYSGGWDDYRECEIACIEYMINLVKNERISN